MSVPKDRSPKAKASSPARPELSGGVGDLDEELTASQMAGLADDPFAAHNPPRHEGESDEDYKRRRVFETIEKLLTAQISKTVNNALVRHWRLLQLVIVVVISLTRCLEIQKHGQQTRGAQISAREKRSHR
jgi:hypothetical protein